MWDWFVDYILLDIELMFTIIVLLITFVGGLWMALIGGIREKQALKAALMDDDDF